MKYVLVFSDGYSIELMKFDDLPSAQSALVMDYNNSCPNIELWPDEFKELSSLDEDSAILYTGESVFVWSIFEI